MFFNLFRRTPPQPAELPWITEVKKVWGLHEINDHAKLSQWLRSDGKTLGDPKMLPWCGDLAETAIKNVLPNEPFPGALGRNPYWARNWLLLGDATDPVYGSVVVFSRGKGGHVGFLVGEDATDFYVLGGNQGNAVNVVRITKQRLLGTRWPKTFANPKIPLPRLTPESIPKSTNEF